MQENENKEGTVVQYILCGGSTLTSEPENMVSASNSVTIHQSSSCQNIIYVKPSPSAYPQTVYHQDRGSIISKQEFASHTVYAKTFGRYISQNNQHTSPTTNIQASHNGHIYFVSPDGSMRQASHVPNVLTDDSKQPLPTVMPGTNIEYRTPGASFVNKYGKIKRPMNAFMLWARSFRSKLSQEMRSASNSEISVRLGEIWSSLPVNDKQPFYLEAERIKNRHRRDFPDWVYQPRKAKKPRGFCEIQHSRLWEQHSDQYTKPVSRSHGPPFRPIVPAPQVIMTSHIPGENTAVSGTSSGLISQHIVESAPTVEISTIQAGTTRPDTLLVTPTDTTNSGQRPPSKHYHEVSNKPIVTTDPSDGYQITVINQTVDEPIPVQQQNKQKTPVKRKTPRKSTVKAESQQELSTSIDLVKTLQSRFIQQPSNTATDGKQDILWPFPLPSVEHQAPVQILFEEASQPDEVPQTGYTDPYDPFYYHNNYILNAKSSNEHLNVDVSSWQQYLNDADHPRDVDQKQQLGTYFASETRKCPSDLEICPTPVASTLTRCGTESETSNHSSTESRSLSSLSSECFDHNQRHNYSRHASERPVSTQNVSKEGNTPSFAYVMSQATQVLNNDGDHQHQEIQQTIVQPQPDSYLSDKTYSVGQVEGTTGDLGSGTTHGLGSGTTRDLGFGRNRDLGSSPLPSIEYFTTGNGTAKLLPTLASESDLDRLNNQRREMETQLSNNRISDDGMAEVSGMQCSTATSSIPEAIPTSCILVSQQEKLPLKKRAERVNLDLSGCQGDVPRSDGFKEIDTASQVAAANMVHFRQHPFFHGSETKHEIKVNPVCENKPEESDNYLFRYHKNDKELPFPLDVEIKREIPSPPNTDTDQVFVGNMGVESILHRGQEDNTSHKPGDGLSTKGSKLKRCHEPNNIYCRQSRRRIR